MTNLTRRQQQIYDYLLENQDLFDHPPNPRGWAFNRLRCLRGYFRNCLQ